MIQTKRRKQNQLCEFNADKFIRVKRIKSKFVFVSSRCLVTIQFRFNICLEMKKRL